MGANDKLAATFHPNTGAPEIMNTRISEPAINPSVPHCSMCGRARGVEGMDVHDYSPFQVVMNQPLGWYSHKEEQMCPECITDLLIRANKVAFPETPSTTKEQE